MSDIDYLKFKCGFFDNQVCGLAVLGKENIMRHAAEQHEGRGAYQCQFCKKVSFFTYMCYIYRMIIYMLIYVTVSIYSVSKFLRYL